VLGFNTYGDVLPITCVRETNSCFLFVPRSFLLIAKSNVASSRLLLYAICKAMTSWCTTGPPFSSLCTNLLLLCKFMYPRC
jgi:hypothetical protein